MQVEPAFNKWSSLLETIQGELFGAPLRTWRASAREVLGLPVRKPIVMVGHQPEFFHPGVLAKFIAGSKFAAHIDGVLVHLVVDHHVGASGTIQFPEQDLEKTTVQESIVAQVDTNIAMKDQGRVHPTNTKEPFTSAITAASGNNAAMQFANATIELMSPWATVDFCVAGSELLCTPIGKEILNEMQRDSKRCIDCYNNAVASFPDCGINFLEEGELPLWLGKHNEKTTTISGDIRPRALLLTLLARLTVGDLFVHGSGGNHYDNIMEHWVFEWLHVKPCNSTMVTATLKLPLSLQTIEDARDVYFSPLCEAERKKAFLLAIEEAARGSHDRLLQYQAMHRWMSTIGTRPDSAKFRDASTIVNRRDWAFPLYPNEMLDQLRDAFACV